MNKIAKLEKEFKKIFETLDVDLNEPDFKETPLRLARMYSEVFAKSEPPVIKWFPNSQNIKELILVRDIQVTTYCPHHIVPVFGKCHVGYIPAEHLVGLSKIVRLVRWIASNPITQESLTEKIADAISEKLQPMGCMVIMELHHGCMKFRGVKDPEDYTITSSIRGVFANPPEGKNPREEMLNLLRFGGSK